MKNLLRSIRLKLGKALLDKKVPKFDQTIPNSILFLRQDGKIGDYIVSSFVFRELKKFRSEIKIGVVCTKHNAYLFQQNPYIDQLYYVKKRSILDCIKCGLKIRKQKYDLVIDPTIMLRNRDLLLLRLIEARNYLGYQKANYQLFNINIEGKYHFSKIYQLALNKIGIEIDDSSYDIPFDKQSAEEISQFLQKNDIKDYIAINFYGAGKRRRINQQNIKQYLSYLTQILPHKKILLLSYPEVTESLRKLSEGYSDVFVYDSRTIFHTIELIRHCSQIISPDTSTVHIASGLNKSIIAMYSSDENNFIQWHPNLQTTDYKVETHILRYDQDINELSPQMIKLEWVLPIHKP